MQRSSAAIADHDFAQPSLKHAAVYEGAAAYGGWTRDANPRGLQYQLHGVAPEDGRAFVRHHKGLDGATHFLTRTLKRVDTEMSLQVLAYNMKRVIAILGAGPMMEAIRA